MNSGPVAVTVPDMRRAFVTQNRSDCVVVRIGADRSRVVTFSAALVAFVGLAFLPEWGSGFELLWLTAAAFVLPTLIVLLVRSARGAERTLVRANSRLLLDGEPLDMARVELRVLKWPFTSVPNGYALSLWVMTASGPEDVPIGQFPTMLEATSLSGTLEEFVQRANTRSTVTFR